LDHAPLERLQALVNVQGGDFAAVINQPAALTQELGQALTLDLQH